ncbi:MAG TPA: twin-arginine translocase TatA/TatE family subunit [Solirubrobacteraceae bacterium]|jgi:sec-independent protein translocase protein TatA
MGLDNTLHILILLLVVVLVFGARRLPEIGRSLGDGMRGFKDSLGGAQTHTMSLDQAIAVPLAAVAVPTTAPSVEATRLSDAAR